MSGGCPRVGNFSDQKWGVSVIAVTRPIPALGRLGQILRAPRWLQSDVTLRVVVLSACACRT